MNKELEIEAEKYAWKKKNPFSKELLANELISASKTDFIAGATSKYVEKQKLELQEEINFLKNNIKGLNELINSDLERYTNLHSLCERQKLKFAIEQLKKLIYSDKEILKMDSKIQSAAVISNMRINKIIKELEQDLS